MAGPDAPDGVTSEEVEPIDAAIPSMDARFDKIGASTMPSVISGRALGRTQFASLRMGHPTQGYVDIADHVTVVATVVQAGPGEHWDGHDIESGHVVLYEPGARHTSKGPPGVEAGLLAVPQELLRQSSEVLGRVLERPHIRGATPEEAIPWVELYYELRAASPAKGLEAAETKILDMLVRWLSPLPRHDRRETRSDLTDHRIVSRVLGYLEAEERWTAPMLRLCEVTGMSERRIQAAFLATFGTPPSTYLRNRALSAARTQLATANEGMCTVTQVAADHDFYHLGRFSRYYGAMYGESPSATLRSPVR